MLGVWSEPNDKRLPRVDIWYIEYYCDDPKCDCRQVLLEAVSSVEGGVLATIKFYWESLEAEVVDARGVDGKRNPHTGSEWEQMVLEAFMQETLTAPKAVARFRRHYQMFKEELRKRGGLPPPHWPRAAAEARASKLRFLPGLKLPRRPRLCRGSKRGPRRV